MFVFCPAGSGSDISSTEAGDQGRLSIALACKRSKTFQLRSSHTIDIRMLRSRYYAAKGNTRKGTRRESLVRDAAERSSSLWRISEFCTLVAVRAGGLRDGVDKLM